MNNSRNSRQRGSAIMEFALVAPFLIMLFFGTVGTGIALGRYITAINVCRDLGHMYAKGIDFSQTTNRNIAVQLASGTGMTANGGNGVVLFTLITTVYQADCDAAGFHSSCNNLNQAVIVQRVVIGDTTLKTSAFGTPTASLLGAQGNISPSVYLQNTDGSVRTANFTPLMAAAGAAQQQGDFAYVVEVSFPYPDLSYLGASTPPSAYVRFIF